MALPNSAAAAPRFEMLCISFYNFLRPLRVQCKIRIAHETAIAIAMATAIATAISWVRLLNLLKST